TSVGRVDRPCGASAAAGIAKVLFFIFIVLFIISLLIGGFAAKKIANAVDNTLHE
ncbi:MAG: DUF1328 family protein, partial [Patescibacteria group bacterium]